MFRPVTGILVGVSHLSFTIALTKPPLPDESEEELKRVGLVCGLRKAWLWWLSA